MKTNENTSTPDPSKEEEEVVETPPVDVSTQAGEQETDGPDKEEDEAGKEVVVDKAEEADDTDEPREDDEDRVWNMKQLRSTKKENIKVKHENKELKAKIEELETKLAESPSETDNQKVAELEAIIQGYKDKESESAKTTALKEAGLSDELLAVLKGEEEEWRATLELLKKTSTPKTSTPRLKDDTPSNGLGNKYKSNTMSKAELLEMVRKSSRR